MRSLCASTRASEQSNRETSCSADISRLKMPTVLPFFAAYCAMFRARAVLPIDGRRGDDDQILPLKAGGHLIEVGEAGRHAGYHFGAAGHLFDLFQSPLRHIPMY